jgi:hypothetical protein
MIWRLIWLLAPIGLLMGILGLFGLTGKIEPLYWSAFGLFAAYVIGRIVPDKPFQHGLIVGLTWITAALIKVILWQTYINFNPTFVSTYEAAGGLDRARLFMLASSPVIAAVMGAVIGFFAWVLFRMYHSPSQTR